MAIKKNKLFVMSNNSMRIILFEDFIPVFFILISISENVIDSFLFRRILCQLKSEFLNV